MEKKTIAMLVVSALILILGVVFACGIILMLWIALEWYIWGFAALSNIYFALGLLEAILAWRCIKN